MKKEQSLHEKIVNIINAISLALASESLSVDLSKARHSSQHDVNSHVSIKKNESGANKRVDSFMKALKGAKASSHANVNSSEVIKECPLRKKKKSLSLKKKGWHENYLDNKQLYEKYIADAANKYSKEIGLPPMEVAKTLKTMMYIESKGDANAVSRTDCRGLFQFAKKTGRSMKLVNQDADLKPFDNRFDPQANTDAAARLLADSAKQLKRKNIPVTPTNLYVIHQQGAPLGGKLLKAKMDNTISDLAINDRERKSFDLNGGKDKSPEQFVDMWIEKYKVNDDKVDELDKPSIEYLEGPRILGFDKPRYENLS
ncbi:transglycosylase SLT domain-containing protein [Hymenobacter sp. UYCo722]|uniref:transglycosylase SLT domain-containing protein n=1 Tax=Hymenobacter sp. UYCo722 TaxID=3156335 RepID=UPI0033952AB9